ncbi:MAG: C39 family peptidase [Candidatus Moraniibacteriota bacterium]
MTEGHRIPFYPQHWDLDQWAEMGFKDREEAEYWQESSCGILCLRMALEGLGIVPNVPIIDLARTGVGMGAYTHEKGWSHDGLCRLAEHYGAEAVSKGTLSTDDLKRFLDMGRLPIVSIKWAFRDVKTVRERLLFWKRFGGHLALLIGYDETGFIVHHTSIRKEYNWDARHLSFSDFERGSTGRTVMVGR